MPTPRRPRARLRFGYADLLEAAGDPDLAERWFASAAALDVDNATDAAERAAALEGVTIIFDEDDDEDEIGGEEDVDGEEAESVEAQPAGEPDNGLDLDDELELDDVAADGPSLDEQDPVADLPPASDGAPDGLPEDEDA